MTNGKAKPRIAGSMSQQVNDNFLAFKESVTKFSITPHEMSRTSLVAKDGVQNVTSVATSEEEHVDRLRSGNLVTEKGNSWSIPDRVEVAGMKGVNRSQHN